MPHGDNGTLGATEDKWVPVGVGTYRCAVRNTSGGEDDEGVSDLTTLTYFLTLRYSDALNTLNPAARLTLDGKQLELVALPENIRGEGRWIKLKAEERTS